MLFKGREKYTNWFWFGDLVKEAASSKYFNQVWSLSKSTTRDMQPAATLAYLRKEEQRGTGIKTEEEYE